VAESKNKMKNNLQTIKEAFTEIADAIEERGIAVDCDPVTTYADKIRSIPSGNGSDFTSATADVYEVEQDSPMTADVEIIEETLAFTFGLRAGAPGKDGSNGNPGKDGKEGGRTIFIYTGSSVYEPTPKVTTPNGGTWNVETNVLTGVTTTDNYS
jgi:hypothetical protein